MKHIQKWTAFFLALALIASLGPLPAKAAENAPTAISFTYINPLYADVITEADLTPPRQSSVSTYEAQKYVTTIEEAGQIIREGMKERQEEIMVYFQTPQANYNKEDFQAKLEQIADYALIHTGVPTEGDYLQWQYGGWECSGKAQTGTADGVAVYLWTITYTYTYYTTADQEQKMDEAVEALLEDLGVSSATDYQKLCAIYDYICATVTYDHDNLNDDSYKLKYTAYAALINKTAVCQGYAVLLYRLALELGVDARLIPGTASNGEAHGWNIAQLHGLYYDLDSTWDAGETDYDYFLKCDANFTGHTRHEDYATEAFYAEYPMSDKDFVPTADDTTCTAHNYKGKVTTEATCTAKGVKTYTCTICGDTYTEDIPATEHSWDDGTVTKEPTETETGIRTYTCTVCKATKTEDIPVKEHTHSYTAVTTDPTCTEQGYTTYTCTCGYNYKDDYVDALGHNLVNPTYDSSSKTHTFSCSRCEYTVTEDCTFDEGKIITEATEETPGEKEYTCTVCGGTYTEEIAYVAPEASSVRRISGKTRFDTAMAIADELKNELGIQTFKTIVVASGANFPDALAGSYLAVQKDAPILLTENNENSKINGNILNYIDKNLHPDGMVYILGGTASVSKAFTDGLAEAGIAFKRLSGKSRYDTNLKILEEATLNGNEILVCSGVGFADALSASAVNKPILLVNGEDTKLTDAQKKYLESLGDGYTFYIVGGTGAVSAELEEALAAYGSVERISGKGRHETSIAVAEKFFGDVDCATLAYSMNYPDGLCGGPLAYKLGAPLLLVKSDSEAPAAEYVKENNIKRGIVFGGTAGITDEAARTVFGLPEDSEIRKSNA